MTVDHSVPEHAELVSRLVNGLCTRTLHDFAAESRLDGESLKDAVDRYEIDYAWQVLGSDRMHDATLSVLEARLQQPVTDEQRACVADVLQAAAAAQAPGLLMSFDNDLPEQLGALLLARFERNLQPAA